MTSVIVLMLIGVLVTAVGDVLISKGMRHLDLSVRGWRDMWRVVRLVGRNGCVLGGIGLLICSFAIWLTLLSKADLSLLLPMTALNYVVNAFLAKLYLQEHVSLARWVGTLVIFGGVIVVVVS